MRVSEKVFIIDTRALGFEQVVACYLVKGRKTALIDTGYSSSSETVIQALKQLGVERLDYIIPTHVHLDHSGGAWKLAQHFPEAVVYAQERAVKHLIDPSKLMASALQFYGQEVLQMLGEVRPIDERRVFKVGDGETLSLQEVELSFIYTPGHAPHQMSVMVSDGSLITADAVPVKYPGKPFIIPTTAPPSFDYDLYIQSLRKIGKMDAEKFLTPHYGPTRAGEEWVEHLIKVVEEWRNLAESVLKEGGGVGRLIEVFEKKLESEAGIALPIYASNLLRFSVLGLAEYLMNKMAKRERP